MDASGRVSRNEWRIMVERLRLAENYPGILGVGYAQVVPPLTLDAFENAVRAEGFADFAVHPPGPRPFYTAILYLEPFKGRNLAAFGYDMFSEPVRREAMQAAAEAMESVYGKKPFFVRGGGSIPVVADFKEILGLDSVLMGFGLDSDAIHSPNEHFGLDRFQEGIQSIIRFMEIYGSHS
ncbi:MAG: M20/M25/M40 family metallo-hydrolase [Bacteroidetes bacterium]|nr:M20/M25/M40 family metallo-hydrolase [Bacteroidota bacterium]